jgi:transcriptional regulator
MPQYTVEEEIEMLIDAGLLTEREAEVFVLRSVEGTPGYAVSDDLEISDSRVSDAKTQAETKIENARATLKALKEIRYQTPLLVACSACGEEYNLEAKDRCPECGSIHYDE